MKHPSNLLCDCAICAYAKIFPQHAGWNPNDHPYLCLCGKCDGTGDPIGAVPVIGAFSIDPDGYLVETEDKDKS